MSHLWRLLLHDLLGHVLEVLPEAVREPPQPDGSEEVDGEARVLGGVPGEDALHVSSVKRVRQPRVQLAEAEVLGKLLPRRERGLRTS